MGRLNKRELVNRLQVMGTASRASLAKSLGLSQPTAGKIVEQLLRAGIVEEVNGNGAADAGRVGRPPRLLRLNRTQRRFLVVQLGVTNTSFAALPVGAHAEEQWQLQLPTPASANAWLAQLKQAADKLRPREFWGVLVSLPGVVDEPGGRVLFSPNLHWTEGADLPDLLQKVWDAPVVLVQEERALALGHQMTEPGSEGFLLADFGEGVGGAILVGGRLQVNPLPIQGELGHTPVFHNERLCGCGAKGCLETLVSTRGLLQSFAEHSRMKAPTWAALVQHVEQHGVPPWLAETLAHTATIIAGALNMLGLQQVVVTGSLLDFPPTVFRYLSEAITSGAMWGRFGHLEVKRAPRRRIAGLLAVGLDRLVLPLRSQGKRSAAGLLAREEF